MLGLFFEVRMVFACFECSSFLLVILPFSRKRKSVCIAWCLLCKIKVYGYVGNFTFSLQQSQRRNA
jgi:hypothetical protein